MAKNLKLIKPGTDNAKAGKYEEVGPRGGAVKKGRHTTIDQGDRLPPSSKKGNMWRHENDRPAPLVKPGKDNEPAGKYEEVGPRGGVVKNGRHTTIEQGDRLPPTSKKGNMWRKEQ